MVSNVERESEPVSFPAKVGSQGRVTIPHEIRKAMGLGDGALLWFQFRISLKPGHRITLYGKSYKAIKPAAILSINLHAETFLVQYSDTGVLMKKWVTLGELEELGIIEREVED